MPSKPKLFTCPSCARSRVTIVRSDLCSACYTRARPRDNRSLATCSACRRTRVAFYRRGLCPGCYERTRRRMFTCGTCHREVEAPYSFAAMAICPRCWSRSRVVNEFTCPSCGRTKRTRPEGGLCRRCHAQGRVRISTCSACGQTRKIGVDGQGRCKACQSAEQARRQGIPMQAPAEKYEACERRLLDELAPLRRPWVREFLQTAGRGRSAKTKIMLLRAVGHFDVYLSECAGVAGGQWTLVTPEHVHGYLAHRGRLRLEEAKLFFRWLRSRKATGHNLARALPRRTRSPRLCVLTTEQVLACYQQWTSADADPRQALVGLLALVHCLRSGEIRHMRLSDVLTPDRLQVGEGTVELAPPVADALARYLAWRREMYGGESSYLIVSRGSRLHDRPVSSAWFSENLFVGLSVAGLRQSAIQRLVQALGNDGLQLAAYTRLSLAAAGNYLKIFRPMPAMTPA